MIAQQECEINAGNIAEIISGMPQAGRAHLAWLLNQGVVSYLDFHVKIGFERYKAEQARMQQWADEWDARNDLEKAA